LAGLAALHLLQINSNVKSRSQSQSQSQSKSDSGFLLVGRGGVGGQDTP